MFYRHETIEEFGCALKVRAKEWGLYGFFYCPFLPDSLMAIKLPHLHINENHTSRAVVKRNGRRAALQFYA